MTTTLVVIPISTDENIQEKGLFCLSHQIQLGLPITVPYWPEGVLGDMRQLQEWVLGVPESLHDVRRQLHAGLYGVKGREAGDASSMRQHDQLSHTRHHLLDQDGAAPVGWSPLFWMHCSSKLLEAVTNLGRLGWYSVFVWMYWWITLYPAHWQLIKYWHKFRKEEKDLTVLLHNHERYISTSAQWMT